METLNEKSTPQPEHRPATSPFSLRQLLPGLAIGILVGVIGLLAYQTHLPGITKALYTITLIFFGVIVVTFLLVFVFRQIITRKILGENSVGDFLNDAQAVSDTVTDQLAQNILVNVPFETRERVRKVLPQLASWFIWGRLRNWWWNWILGIFVSLGGLAGTMLLMNQNELLNNQNTLIQRQMSLEEASRRSALVVLMSNIMDKVDREIEDQKKRNTLDTVFSLSPSLIGQIAALSHSFKPYRYLDGDTLITKPLSPERGQLLITLTRLPLDTSIFRQIYRSSNFAYADLPSANFEGMFLKGVNLSGADLSKAVLNRADLSEAVLSGAVLNETDLSNAVLSRADLSNAVLREAGLSGADLVNAHLSGAQFVGASLMVAHLMNIYMKGGTLSGTDLSEADLSGAELTDVILDANFERANLRNTLLNDLDFNRTSLYGADLSEARLSYVNLTKVDLTLTDLKNADFWWVNLKRANVNIRQMESVRSLHECEIHDSITTELLKTNPQLFKRGEEIMKEALEHELQEVLKDGKVK
jgi:uncharacterized protein YjbI with pentapeptide repeats